MSEQYFLDLDGKTGGPFSLEELRGLWQGKAITEETLFCKPNGMEWLPIKIILPLLRDGSAAAPAASQTAAPARPFAWKYDYICTMCGHVGLPKKETKGSFFIELILWFFLLVPGVIYSIWRLTTRYQACAKCKSAAVIPANSPKGRELVCID